MDFKFNLVGYIGIILTFLGGYTLDSKGKEYCVSVVTLIAGLILMIIGLYIEYNREKRVQESRLKRTLEREKRKQIDI